MKNNLMAEGLQLALVKQTQEKHTLKDTDVEGEI